MIACSLIACSDCDAFQSVAPGARAACFRCGAVVAPPRGGGEGGLARPLAFTLAAIPLLVAANLLPLVRMESPGGPVEATVLGVVAALREQDMPALALLVLLMTAVVPAIRLGGAAVLLIRARARRSPRAAVFLLQVLEATRPWPQLEILLAGTLIALGKLGRIFHLAPGVGLLCLVGFLLLEHAVGASLDPRTFWTRTAWER